MSLADQNVYPSQPLDRHGAPIQELDRGITLLQHYAGLAMQGILASNEHALAVPYLTANQALAAAKALLDVLEKEQNQ